MKSNTDSLQRKRPRTDSDAASHSPKLSEIKRDEDFWYEDGNVVLVAGQLGFRVYKRLLADQSDVFRDLFTLPQPSQSDQIDSCPIVRLSDSSEQLRSLLRALLHGKTYLKRDKIKFSVLADLIRLGHKYQVAGLQEDVMAYLKTYYTDDFSVWSSIVNSGTTRAPPAVSLDPADAIAAVDLARLTNADSILPIALYSCCQLDSLTLLDGVQRADGAVETLSKEDLVRCIDGKARLHAQNADILSRVFSTDLSPSCKDHDLCEMAIEELHAAALAARSLNEACVLTSWGTKIASEMKNSDLCKKCEQAFKARDGVERKRVWSNLPLYVGIEVEGWSGFPP